MNMFIIKYLGDNIAKTIVLAKSVTNLKLAKAAILPIHLGVLDYKIF